MQNKEGTVEIVAIFKKGVAAFIKELSWDSFKEIKERQDGSIKVKMEMEGGKPLLHWLMGFGTDVQIVSPKNFREIFIQKLKSVLDLYEPKDPASSNPVLIEGDLPSKHKRGSGSRRK